MEDPVFVFDLMDTILHDPYFAAISRLLKPETFEFYRKKRNFAIFQSFEKGKISEDEFFSNFYEELVPDLPHPREIKARMFQNVTLILEMEEFVYNLQDKATVVLGSNYSEWYKHLFDFPRVRILLERMDKLYFSCELGVRKPDAQFFQKIESDFPGRNYVFVDDNHRNVLAAQTLGWNAVLFRKDQPQELLEWIRNQYPSCL